MSLENAKQNLKEFGKELNLEGLAFDENNTCILGIDNAFSLHLTYEPNSDRLYLYAPILDGLPKDAPTKLKLYEALMEGAMLGGQMAGGGIGVAVREELILMHTVLEMSSAADPNSLRRFAPLFVEAVEKWRTKAKDLLEGREEFTPRDWGAPPEQQFQQQQGNAPQGGKKDDFKPGDHFKKV